MGVRDKVFQRICEEPYSRIDNPLQMVLRYSLWDLTFIQGQCDGLLWRAALGRISLPPEQAQIQGTAKNALDKQP